jgi:hypothetical protein
MHFNDGICSQKLFDLEPNLRCEARQILSDRLNANKSRSDFSRGGDVRFINHLLGFNA